MDLLLQSSENIKSLIHLMTLHEENIARNITIREYDISMNTHTYIEFESNQDKGNSMIETFKPNDPMIRVRECGHIFKKEYFINWIKSHNTCMYCPAVLF